MNLNPNKVKQLVLTFADLDDEYQKQLLAEAFRLQFMQSQKNSIVKEGKQFQSPKAMQEEIESRTNKRFTEITNLMEKLENIDDTSKAAFFMFVYQLAGKGNVIQEPEITITVNQKEISMKDYLEMHLNNADYDKAKSICDDFMDQTNQSKSHKETHTKRA